MTDLAAKAPQATDAVEIFAEWFERFAEAVAARDATAVADLVVVDGWWRDLLSLTWDLSTFHGREEIADMLAKSLPQMPMTQLRLVADVPPSRNVAGDWIQGFFDFVTPVAKGRGIVRLTSEDGETWGAWTVHTTMEDLNGHERSIRHNRPMGPRHEPGHSTQDNWLDGRRRTSSFEASEPEVVIVGAGQGGLAVAAHLGLMGVDTLVLEQNARVGDSWRKRYHSLVLHDPVWADHLPYLPFPTSWPVYTPKDKIANWFELYAEAMELNVWTNVQLTSSNYDEDTARWTVRVTTADGVRELKPAHVVLATGASGEPNLPELPGASKFGGTIIHSSGHQSAVKWAGRKAVVIGACNSGHDIAQDLYEAGADVTMIQRSSTYIMSQKHGIPTIFGALYYEGGLPTDYADLLNSSFPWPVVLQFAQEQTKQIAELDAELRQRLEAVGFRLNDGLDGGGLMSYALRNGGGYYIDVGCSELIADGRIALRQGVGVSEFTERGLRLEDGTTLEADLVIFATGYSNMRETARRLFGGGVADRVRPVLGLDENNELNTLWRSSGHPGLWFMGGPLAWVRIYSKYLALQIAGVQAGLNKP